MNKVTDVYDDRSIVDGMVERYQAVDTDETRAKVVAELAAEFAKSVQSIRAKLVREGVYVAKVRKTKTGDAVVTKAKMVDMVAEALGIDFTEAEATSLEKATKATLRKLLNAESDPTDV